MSDDNDLPKPSDFLTDARRDFPQFYLLAAPEDEMLMDTLVILRVALLLGINAPRDHVVDVIRCGLEKVTDKTEHSFTEFREAVRGCQTFGRIGDEERAQIEREVFELGLP